LKEIYENQKCKYCKPLNICMPFDFASSEICGIKRRKQTDYAIFKMLNYMDAKVVISPKGDVWLRILITDKFFGYF
jgi:hypothetical protein